MISTKCLRVNSEVYLSRRRGQVNMRKCFDQETDAATQLFGVRRHSEAATALWIRFSLENIQSGVALRLPARSIRFLIKNVI